MVRFVINLFRANYLKRISQVPADNVSLIFAECQGNNLAVIAVGKIGGNMGDEKREFWNLMKNTFNNKTSVENVISILSLYLPPIFPLSSPQDTLINSKPTILESPQNSTNTNHKNSNNTTTEAY
jgi:hypothetical protein